MHPPDSDVPYEVLVESGDEGSGMVRDHVKNIAVGTPTQVVEEQETTVYEIIKKKTMWEWIKMLVSYALVY